MMITLLLGFVASERILVPMIQTQREIIRSSTYELYSYQNLTLVYDFYSGAYSLDVWKVGDNNTRTIQPTIQERDYQLEQNMNSQGNYQTKQGCFAHARYLDVAKQIVFGGLIDQGQQTQKAAQLIDFEVIQDLNRVLLLRSDQIIQEAQFLYDREQPQNSKLNIQRQIQISDDLTFKSIQISKLDFKQSSQDSSLICLKNHFCYIFSQNRVIYYNFMDQEIYLNFQTLNDTSVLHKIIYVELLDIIIIAEGSLGLGFYKFNKNGSLIAEENHIELPAKVDVRDISVSEEGNLLYLLDYNSGLHVYEILSIKFIKKPFFIKLHRAKKFGMYKQTFFIVATTNNLIDYALEVFLDLTSGDYYFNKYESKIFSVYKQDMQIYNIYVQKHWAIFIGLDAHRVVYHSVYNKFIGNPEKQFYFDEYDLLSVEGIYQEEDYTVLLGLSGDDVRLLNVISVPPKVSCFNESGSEATYLTQMNSTSCLGKSQKNDHSQFSQCYIEHEFRLKTIQVYVNEGSRTLVYGLGIFIIANLTVMALICVLCVRKWSKQLALLREQSMVLKYRNQQDDEAKSEQLVIG